MINTNYKPLTELINYLELKEKILKPKPMKTAMQELIDEMDVIKHELWNAGQRDKAVLISDMITKAVIGLEKEKEQILAAYENGVGDENERNLSGKFTNAEEYYNKTYNQNK